jgi:hypothetical protein
MAIYQTLHADHSLLPVIAQDFCLSGLHQSENLLFPFTNPDPPESARVDTSLTGSLCSYLFQPSLTPVHSAKGLHSSCSMQVSCMLSCTLTVRLHQFSLGFLESPLFDLSWCMLDNARQMIHFIKSCQFLI